MSDEVQIEAYDPAWPALYLDEARRLGSVFRGGTLLTMEHIGSTAVPGLAAKPVIDLMGLVKSLDAARQSLIAPIEALGYAYWADNPAPDRMFFVRGLPPAPCRTHHLHLVERPSELRRHLVFRDELRRDPELLLAYAELKWRLAKEHKGDREAYTSAKKAFIDQAIAKAPRHLSSDSVI